MSFGRKKQAKEPQTVDGLSLEELRHRWIGNIDGQISTIISKLHPTEPFDAKVVRAFEMPLTQEDLGWLRTGVRYGLCGRIGYSFSAGDIVQTTRDIGKHIVEFSVILTPEPDHPVKVFN